MLILPVDDMIFEKSVSAGEACLFRGVVLNDRGVLIELC